MVSRHDGLGLQLERSRYDVSSCAAGDLGRTIPTMADEITLKTVLDHIAAMEQRLSGRFGGVESNLSGVEKSIVELSGRVEGVEGRLARVEKKLQLVEVNLSRQIDGIDRRLDEIEIEQLPKRVTALEAAATR